MRPLNIKALVLLALGLVSAILLYAQAPATTEPVVYKLSVKEAVDIAFKNFVDVQNSKYDVDLQRLKNREITGQAYPQLKGSFQVNHYPNIPVTVLPDFISPSVYGVLVNNGVKDGNGNPILMPSNFGNVNAQFGTPWTASAGVTLEQLLFQADVFIGLKARKTAMDYASNNAKVTEDKVRENVYKAYYMILIGQKKLSIVQSAVKRLEKLRHDMQVMYDNGFSEKLDINRTDVNLSNLRTTETQLKNLVQVGDASLKYNLGIAQKDSLLLTDTLSESELKTALLDDGSFQYEDRNEIKVLNSVKKLQQLDLQRNKLSYVPTIAAFASQSYNAQRQKFDLFNNRKWFPTTVIGLSVNIPIFDGLQRDSRIKTARINLKKTETTLEGVKKAIDLEKNVARIQLTNALMTIDEQKRNMLLAESVYTTTKKKYEQGLGSSFEVLQSENDLEQSESNYFQALYDAVIAKVSYLRSIGKL
jgi:outer membrane protein TolC